MKFKFLEKFYLDDINVHINLIYFISNFVDCGSSSTLYIEHYIHGLYLVAIEH